MKGGLTLENLAKDKSFSPRPLAKLLDCLTSMGLLKKTLVQGSENGQSEYTEPVNIHCRATIGPKGKGGPLFFMSDHESSNKSI